MTAVSFQVGSGPPVSIDFDVDSAAPLTLAQQIEAAFAAATNPPTQVITTSESLSTSDPFVLISSTGADTVLGSGSQSMVGGNGGLTYTNDDDGASVSVALNGGNNTLTFGAGVNATVATGATGSDSIFGGSGSLNVSADGTDTIDGGTGYATVSGGAGANLTIDNTVASPLIEVLAGAGAETINASGTAGGALVFTSGGNDTITGGSGYFFVQKTQGGQVTVTAGAGSGLFEDIAVATPSSETINDFGAADSIDIEGTSSVQAILANGVVTNGNLTLTLAPGNTMTFVGVTSLNGHVIDPDQGAITVCYVAGTRVLTDRGEVAIEDLGVGDRVVTASGALEPVRWLGARRIDCAHHPERAAVWPVRIHAGAFAQELPARDLWVSPGHSIFVDGVLIQAEKLVNDATIMQVPLASVEYWHVELDHHDILLAEGLPAESYLDTGNRAGFFNNGGSYLEAHTDFRPKHWAETCVPLVFDGAILQGAKARLLERAQALGFRLTADSDVHIVAAGERIEPLFCNEQRVAFVLPPDREGIELRCRGFIPAHIDALSQDRRRLGVCVARLQIDGVDLALDDDAAFARGWHELEVYSPQQRQRWSHESAPLPDGTRLVVIELAARSYCWAPMAEVATTLRRLDGTASA